MQYERRSKLCIILYHIEKVVFGLRKEMKVFSNVCTNIYFRSQRIRLRIALYLSFTLILNVGRERRKIFQKQWRQNWFQSIIPAGMNPKITARNFLNFFFLRLCAFMFCNLKFFLFIRYTVFVFMAKINWNTIKVNRCFIACKDRIRGHLHTTSDFWVG